jgi:hypothetical protein
LYLKAQNSTSSGAKVASKDMFGISQGTVCMGMVYAGLCIRYFLKEIFLKDRLLPAEDLTFLNEVRPDNAAALIV